MRERVDELFQAQSSYPDTSAGAPQEILKQIYTLRRSLQSNRAALSKDEYLAATKFLAGLRLEAELLAERA